MEQKTQEEVLREALARLHEVAPTILILDLRWSLPSRFFEGERFLRLAITQNLLGGVHLIFWSQYLKDAAVRIERMTPLLVAAGVKSIAQFYKSELGGLVAQLRTLGCRPQSKIIIVLDDQWNTREPVLKRLIGDRAEVQGISKFTVTGEAAPAIIIDMMAQLNPAAIIADLAIIPEREDGKREREENPMRGIDLLSRVRLDPLLGATPLLVVSNHTKDRRLKAHFDRLGVLGAFEWGRIREGDRTVLEEFSLALDKALNQTSERPS
jgi:hypothetical protein